MSLRAGVLPTVAAVLLAGCSAAAPTTDQSVLCPQVLVRISRYEDWLGREKPPMPRSYVTTELARFRGYAERWGC
jgi:hypothetical protein